MRLKRIGCFILAVVLSLPLALPVNSYAAGKFKDTAGHWAESYINTAVSKNIITGYPDGRFLPDKAVTRAEFATMVNKALGNSSSVSLSFKDVDRGEWYYSDVAKAVAATYTAGYDDNTFRPNNPISRQEAAVMISRFVPTYGESGNLRSYSDYSSVADWAYDAMEKVNGKGYIGAYTDGKIHPTDQLTRAQTAKILIDIINNETIVTGTTTIDEDGDKLSGKIYANNVNIDEDLGEDSATIENSVILGTLSVKGGGTDSITINNSRVANVTVNKDDDPVRVLAKGETAIVKLSASQSSILQTSSLKGGLFGPGFSNITVNSSAEVTLRGSFPKVTVSGSKAELILDSGSIDTLTVSGKESDITAESGTTIDTATVNAESYFHGSGTISQMNVNADGITYETKPKHWTIKSSADTPTQSDGVSKITFSPKNGATNVKLDTKITITFDSKMELYDDGDTITNSDIDNFVELHKGSSTGSEVDYTATINSAKTVITITPDEDLSKNTKYYVIIYKNSVQDEDENGNAAQSIYFTTGDDTGSVTTKFNPADGATAVPVNSNITITFSDDVVKYSNGANISTNDSYLEDSIVLKKTSSSGSSVPFSASINSSKTVITINPDSNLALNQKYYVAIVSSKLKTNDSEETIPADSVTWITGITTPAVSTLTLSPGETTITASLTSNVAGTAYLVALPKNDPAPSADQVVAGQDKSGIPVDSGHKASGSVTANMSKTFSFSGFASNTEYYVYAVVRANNTNSAVKQVLAKTATPVTRLTKLEVIPTVDGDPNPGNQISFSPSTTSYEITLNTDITELRVNAAGSGNISINGAAAVADSASTTVTLDGGNQTIPVAITKDGTNGTTYSIVIVRENNDNVATLRVTADGRTISGDTGGYYQLTTTKAVKIGIAVTADDEFATVVLDGAESVGTGNISIDLPAGTKDEEFTFSIISGSKTGNYTLTFMRPTALKAP